jgi:phage anti-repressor protein
MDLYDMLKTEFTGEDEDIFVTNFKYCLEHDQYNDFVINLDDILHYLGYTRKDTAKKIILKYFEENTSYKLLRFGPEHDQGGVSTSAHNKERILLSPNTFKELCLIANTEKAKRIRMYYIRMEMVLSRYISKQNEEILKTSSNKVKTLESELKMFRGRKRNKYEFGDTVYIVKEGNLFKVGSAANMNNREDNYFCHSNLAKVVYAKRCHNRKILEDVMHHKFTNFIYNNRKDWFIGVEFEALKKAMDDFQLLLDNETSTYTIDIEALNDDKNNKIFYQEPGYIFTDDKQVDDILIKHIVPINVCDVAPYIPNNQVTSIDVKDTNTNINKVSCTPIPSGPFTTKSSTIGSSPSPSTNESSPSTNDASSSTTEDPPTIISPLPDIPPDFDGFLRECFVLNEDVKTSWVEIGAKYKLWSRSLEQVKNALFEYLKQKSFKDTFLYREDTKSNCIAFQGLEMIPIKPLEISDTSTEIERFVYDTCVNNVTGRVASKDIQERFVEWKNASKGDYLNLVKDDKQKLSGFFNNNFLPATVHNGERMRFGYYGVSLKGTEDVGTKPKWGNRKSINMVHPHTGDIVRTYESITHASKELGVTISAVSIAISGRKICKGYLFNIA